MNEHTAHLSYAQYGIEKRNDEKTIFANNDTKYTPLFSRYNHPEFGSRNNNENSVFNNNINNYNTFTSNSSTPSSYIGADLMNRKYASNTNNRKHTTKSRKLKKGDRLSRSSSQLKEACESMHNYIKYNSFNNIDKTYTDDPMNDVYQNLAKFLTKNFCKHFKIRRSMNGNKKATTTTTTTTDVKADKNRLNMLFKNMNTVAQKPLVDHYLPTQLSFSSVATNNTNATLVKTNLSPSEKAAAFVSPIFGLPDVNANKIIEDYFAKSDGNFARSRTMSNSAANEIVEGDEADMVKSRKDSYVTRSNANLADLGFNFFDEESIDLFPGSSCRSSTFDIDFSIGILFIQVIFEYFQ